ncbi:MAG: TlpA family protein disulfide reductase [Actinomycetes bacterium]
MRARTSPRARRARGRSLTAAAVVAAAVLLVGCGGSPSGDRVYGGSGGTAASAEVATGLTRWAPADRPALPRLAGHTLDGDLLDVADWRGHVVVVNTWGSWCGPCREEASDLRRAFEDTKADGVRFVGIGTRDNDAAARAFVREFAIGYPSLVDDDGRLMLAFGRTIPVSAVPTTLVVDARGRIAARVIGAVTYPTLRGLIDDTRTEPRRTAQEKGGGS